MSYQVTITYDKDQEYTDWPHTKDEELFIAKTYEIKGEYLFMGLTNEQMHSVIIPTDVIASTTIVLDDGFYQNINPDQANLVEYFKDNKNECGISAQLLIESGSIYKRVYVLDEEEYKYLMELYDEHTA